MDHAVEQRPRAARSSSARGSPTSSWRSRGARLRSRRRHPRQVQHRPHPRRARRTSSAEKAAKRRAAPTAAQSQGASAASRGTVRAQRARLLREQRRPLPLDRGQHVDGPITCTGANGTSALHRPDAAWPSGSTPHGNRLGERQPRRLHRHRRQPGLLPVPLPGLPARQQGRRRRRTRRTIRSRANGDVDTIAVKEWIAKNPPGYAAGFKRGFITRYYNGARGVPEDARPRGRVPEHLRGHQAARADARATSARPRRCSATRTPRHGPTATVVRPLRRQQPARRRRGADRPPRDRARSC